MSSLLEEAIVDAKALKEAALKNAENAVLEKYSAEVRGTLSALLEQDELGLATEDTDEGADATFIENVPYGFQNEELEGASEDELVEIDFDQLKARIAEEESAGVEPAADAVMDATEVATDLALEEGDEEDPTFKQMADDEDEAEKSTAVASSGGGTAGLPLEEDDDIAITEEMLSDLIEELVVDMVPRPQGWSSVNSADNSIEQANDMAMASANDAHLEEEEIDAEVRTAPDVVSDAELYEGHISKLTESTKELRALLTEAKTQLTQLNLENAKLVYQNKALSSASLNERQKNQIAEAVQSANSVEEASMIYETIQNAVGATNSSNGSRPQTLREAVTRPTSLLINSKKNNKVTKDPNMDRMLRLAGLTKQ